MGILYWCRFELHSSIEKSKILFQSIKSVPSWSVQFVSNTCCDTFSILFWFFEYFARPVVDKIFRIEIVGKFNISECLSRFGIEWINNWIMNLTEFWFCSIVELRNFFRFNFTFVNCQSFFYSFTKLVMFYYGFRFYVMDPTSKVGCVFQLGPNLARGSKETSIRKRTPF